MAAGERCVVLLSGGLDSATVLAMALGEGLECHCLTVDYGQRHAAELEAARAVARSLGAASHRFVRVDLREIGGSALTDDIAVPKDGPGEGIPVTYVPARNTVMLAVALGHAEVLDARHIFVGVNAVDYSGYPDCRPTFLAAFQDLANVATKAAVEGRPLTVHAPLMNLTKAEIIQEGLRMGVNYSLTLSCYDPEGDKACGACDACRIRLAAFKSLGLDDPGLGRETS